MGGDDKIINTRAKDHMDKTSYRRHHVKIFCLRYVTLKKAIIT